MQGSQHAASAPRPPPDRLGKRSFPALRQPLERAQREVCLGPLQVSVCHARHCALINAPSPQSPGSGTWRITRLETMGGPAPGLADRTAGYARRYLPEKASRKQHCLVAPSAGCGRPLAVALWQWRRCERLAAGLAASQGETLSMKRVPAWSAMVSAELSPGRRQKKKFAPVPGHESLYMRPARASPTFSTL